MIRIQSKRKTLVICTPAARSLSFLRGIISCLSTIFPATRSISILRSSIIILATLVQPFLSSCQRGTTNDAVEYIPASANIWHLEIASPGELILADYDGNVQLFDLKKNRTKWAHRAGAFIFDMQVADIDLDGNPETLFVTAQGELIVLDHKGVERWRFTSDLPLFNVVTGNFTGDDQLEIACGGIDRHVYVLNTGGSLIDKSEKVERVVHRLAAGNLDDDPYDEILAIEARIYANLMEIDNDKVVSAWRKPLKVPADRANWENPRGNFFPFSIRIADLDGDGVNEILMGDTFFNKQAVMVTDHRAEPIWISEGLPGFRKTGPSLSEFYSTAFVRAADIDPAIPGKEVISVAGGQIRIWSATGELLGSQNCRIGFTDLEVHGNDLYLGSCPNGDDYIYRLSLQDGWEDALADMTFRGKIETIKSNTEKIKSQVLEASKELTRAESYDIILGWNSGLTTKKGLEEYRSRSDWFRETFPYNNLRLIRSLKVMEPEPPLDENGEPWSTWRWSVDAINGTSTVEEILQKAAWIEEHEIPTMFYIGHSCMPFITLNTAEKILQTAPNWCLGFQSAEDEQLEALPRYFQHYYRPLANLCVSYDKLISSKNKGLWWLTSPSNDSVFDGLFGWRRKEATLSSTEDSNSRTPELNLMARGGLWQAGLLSHNDVSIHRDLFSFNRFHQWEYPKAGHSYLRLLVAHTTMGMTRFSSRIRELSATDNGEIFETEGAESVEIYLHLLGKNLLFSPKREQILGYSPVGFVMHHPTEKFLRDAHNGHSPEIWKDDPELNNAVLPHNGNLWGMTNTPDHALQKVLFNKERQYGYEVPATPYGLVAFVPEQADLSDVSGVEEWWHTDGIYIWQNENEEFTGAEAAEIMEKVFSRAAEKLAFRQTGPDYVFMNAVELSDGHYRLYLVDPGWIDPEDHTVNIRIQLEGRFVAHNVLSGKEYEIADNHFIVPVDAGLFSIVDVTVAGE